jgi:hypothetical protein
VQQPLMAAVVPLAIVTVTAAAGIFESGEDCDHPDRHTRQAHSAPARTGES